MKYILAICLVLITFVVLHRLYVDMNIPDTSYTITVPKACTLNQVVEGEDYIFDCPK